MDFQPKTVMAERTNHELLPDHELHSFTPKRIRIWSEVKRKGTVAYAEIPTKLSKLKDKCGNALLMLYATEMYVVRLQAHNRAVLEALREAKMQNEELERDAEELYQMWEELQFKGGNQ